MPRRAPRRTVRRRRRPLRRRRVTRRKKTGMRKYVRPDMPSTRIARAVVAPGDHFMPETMLIKHQYSMYGIIQPEGAEGSRGRFTFNLNWLYDVDQTGGGHQPRGYDQMLQLYYAYTVEEVRYKIQFYVATDDSVTTTACNMRTGVIIGPQGYPSQFVSLSDFNETPVGKYNRRKGLLQRSASMVAAATQDAKDVKYTGKIVLKDLVAHYGNRDYMSVSASNNLKALQWPQDYSVALANSNTNPPNSVPQLTCWVTSLPQDGVGEYGALLQIPYVYIAVDFEYIVKWYTPIIQRPSLGPIGATGSSFINTGDPNDYSAGKTTGHTGDVGPLAGE